MENKIVQNSKKRKFQRTLNGIEKGLWLKYKRNCLQQNSLFHLNQTLEDDTLGLPISLGCSFVWMESPEGFEFWDDVFTQLKAL